LLLNFFFFSFHFCFYPTLLVKIVKINSSLVCSGNSSEVRFFSLNFILFLIKLYSKMYPIICYVICLVLLIQLFCFLLRSKWCFLLNIVRSYNSSLYISVSTFKSIKFSFFIAKFSTTDHEMSSVISIFPISYSFFLTTIGSNIFFSLIIGTSFCFSFLPISYISSICLYSDLIFLTFSTIVACLTLFIIIQSSI
jgi:hypothetical protein